ncbi:MAG: hypothetical protein AB7I57_21215, partial [Pirellulales bacterium]
MAKELIPGQRIRALPGRSLTAAIAAGEMLAQWGPPPWNTTAPHVVPHPFPYLVAPCKNTIAAALKERSIVGIKETAFDLPDIDTGTPGNDEADVAVLNGEPVDIELPNPTKHTAGRWGVTLGPLAAAGDPGDCGWMVIGGLVKVRLLQTDENHKAAKVVLGVTDYLESAASGVPVTWRKLQAESGEDTELMQWAQINLGSGGLGDHFQIIRGATTAEVAPTDVAFQITGVSAYEQYASTPTTPTWIKAPAGGVTLTAGTSIWAIYRENVLTFDPGSGDVQVDWLMFEPGSTDPPKPRYFELTAVKTLAQNTATVKWVSQLGLLYGSDVVIHDPGFRFSGRPASYYGGEELGFRGYAVPVSDVAGLGVDRWEIVVMESFAEWCVVQYYGAGIWQLLTDAFGGGEYDYRRPTGNLNPIGVIDPAAILPTTLTQGMKAIARMAYPDTTPPVYAIHGVKGGGGGAGGLVTVYINQSIPKATQNGTSFTPTKRTVERYNFNEANGRYERGAAIEIENHSTGDELLISEGGSP